MAERICLIKSILSSILLLGKWIWCLGMDKGGLWKEIFESKYGDWRNLREGKKNRKDSLW